MKNHLPKSNRNQFHNTSNHTKNRPNSESAKERPALDPVVARAPAALARAESGTPRRHPSRSDKRPPPKRIALVENDPDSILIIEKALQSAPADWRLEIHSSTEHALRQIPARPPSAVLIATGLPGFPTAECVHRLRVLLPATPILILSANPAASDIIRCLGAGASGHLLKSTLADEFLSALHRALEGETVICPRTQALLASHFRTSADRPRTRRLTSREEEVLGYVGQGLLNKEIADKLGTSVANVRSHLVNIFGRLGVHDRRAACRVYEGLQA